MEKTNQDGREIFRVVSATAISSAQPVAQPDFHFT